MHSRKFFTLKTRLVLLFLALALVPMSVIGGFSVKTTESLIEDLVLRQLDNLASDKASLLERWLEERKHDMQVIAGTSVIKSMNPDSIGPYIDLIKKHYGVYNDISVINSDNKVVFGSEKTVLNQMNILPWNYNHESLLLSPVTYLPEERESTFLIAAPVVENETCMGTVIGTVGTHKIITVILAVSLGKTGECYLVDRDGKFLAHREPERILTENISQSQSFKNIFYGNDRKKSYLDYRNIEVLGTFRKVGETDWYIVVEQDRNEAFQGMKSLKHLIYFTVFLAIGSALLLTWVISGHVIGPVRQLSHSVRNLELADINSKNVNYGRSDEIGILYRAFAEMAKKIEDRHSNLEQRYNLKEAELKETDQTLKQVRIIAERSERFAALGRLGAAVAHEIRTPLTSLKLFLESVQGEVEISPEYAEDFDIAMKQISRIEVAINRLLDYTKPKDMEFFRVKVEQVINETINLVRPMANRQECVIEVNSKSTLPEIYCDKKLLEEALINIFINALEASRKGGRIEVTLDKDTFSRESEGSDPVSSVRIDIADSGPGIPIENMGSIFEPFFTTKSAGTGLGLPMVFNTIKRHGGEIQVTNSETGGALISLWLPIKVKEENGYRKDTADR